MNDDAKTCPHCLSEIPDAASRCRFCAADIYAPADADTRGWWLVGIIASVFGAILIAGGSDAGQAWGFVVLGIGGVILEVGIIATGVSVGIRDAERRAFDLRQAITRRFTGEDL